MLSSLLCGLEFNLARHINALLPFDRRGGFQLSNQPVHIFLESICRPKRIDAQRTEEMTAGVLIGIKRSRRPRQHAANSSFPAAAVVVAMSRTKGSSLSAGTAKHIGLVPNLDSRPKVGTTCRLALVIAIPIISCDSACIA